MITNLGLVVITLQHQGIVILGGGGYLARPP